MRGATILLALLVATSGCLGGSSKKTDDSDDGSGGPTLTGIEGWILDQARQPVDGALVRLLSDDRNLTTGPDGAYLFEPLPTDEVIIIVVEHPQFEIASKSVTLEPDVRTRLNFTLTPLPTKVATVDTPSRKGFLACQMAFTMPSGQEPRYDCSTAVPGNNDEWILSVGPDLAGIVVEIYWVAGSELARYLNVTVETLDFGDLNTILASTEGPSILRAQVSTLQTEKYYSEGGKIRIHVKPSTYAEEQEAGAGAAWAFQQEFQVVASLFYVEPPPSDYSINNA